MTQQHIVPYTASSETDNQPPSKTNPAQPNSTCPTCHSNIDVAQPSGSSPICSDVSREPYPLSPGPVPSSTPLFVSVPPETGVQSAATTQATLNRKHYCIILGCICSFLALFKPHYLMTLFAIISWLCAGACTHFDKQAQHRHKNVSVATKGGTEVKATTAEGDGKEGEGAKRSGEAERKDENSTTDTKGPSGMRTSPICDKEQGVIDPNETVPKNMASE